MSDRTFLKLWIFDSPYGPISMTYSDLKSKPRVFASKKTRFNSMSYKKIISWCIENEYPYEVRITSR